MRTYGRPLAALTVLLVLGVSACSAPAPAPALPGVPSAGVSGGVPATTASAGATQDRAPARQYLEALANGIGGRAPGTAAEARAAAYIRETLQSDGYAVEVQQFTFGRRNPASSANVIAVKQGASSQEIVVGAHYDAVDKSDGGSDGADDNASGVAALLALAHQLRGVETPYTIRLVAFGAEEADDMYGSQFFVANLSVAQRTSIVAMINLDCLAVGDIAYVYGDATTLREWTRAAAAQAGFRLDTRPVSDLHEDSDYYAFQEAGVSFLYFEATNWDLGDRDGFTQVDPRYGDEGAIIETPYDNLAYLDATFPGRVDERLNLFGTLLRRITTDFHG